MQNESRKTRSDMGCERVSDVYLSRSEREEHIRNEGDRQAALVLKRRGNRSGVTRVGACILGERKRRGWRFDLSIMRLREIEKLINARHGATLPETDDACIYVEAVALAKTGQDLRSWCAVFAPFVRAEELAGIDDKAAARKRMQSADAVAHHLRVSMQERTELGLKTIGAFDIEHIERKRLVRERKRERDRVRLQEKRAAARISPPVRAGSISRLKPWKAEGISRATWYRRMRQDLSRIDINTKSDKPVSRSSGALGDAMAKPAERVKGQRSLRVWAEPRNQHFNVKEA